MTIFPNVPPYPGVPPLVRAQNAIVPILTEISDDAHAIINAFKGPQWGLFDSQGRQALVADSVASIEFKRDYRVASYPIEQGGFQSYNKVETPYDVRLMFTIGQTSTARAGFLATTDDIVASTLLFSAATPEATYISISPYSYSYRRETKNGATLLKVDLLCVKVRQNTTSQFSNTQQPSGANTVNNGLVQPLLAGSNPNLFT